MGQVGCDLLLSPFRVFPGASGCPGWAEPDSWAGCAYRQTPKGKNKLSTSATHAVLCIKMIMLRVNVFSRSVCAPPAAASCAKSNPKDAPHSSVLGEDSLLDLLEQDGQGQDQGHAASAVPGQSHSARPGPGFVPASQVPRRSGGGEEDKENAAALGCSLVRENPQASLTRRRRRRGSTKVTVESYHMSDSTTVDDRSLTSEVLITKFLQLP